MEKKPREAADAVTAEKTLDRKKSLCEAAKEGDATSLLGLLEEDAPLLDRFVSSCYSETPTPLHIASMLGHVDEILNRKPVLAKELDSRNPSPLHLATAKGYLDIVKRLLQVNPDMCDRDGRNPLHIAAIKGHLSVLRELVQAKPSAARELMQQGDTILHACVRHNQLEALKFLLETVADRELLNHKNYDGKNVLNLAVADKILEAVKVLLATATEEVLNSENESDIAEYLECVRSVRGKNIHSSKHDLEETISSSPTTDPKNQAKHRKKDKKTVLLKHMNWLGRKKTAGSTDFQEDTNKKHPEEYNNKLRTAGDSILADCYPELYALFQAFNTVTGCLASLSIIPLLLSRILFRRRILFSILMMVMWVAITAMAVTNYLQSALISAAYTPDHESSVISKVLATSMLVWIVLMLLMLLLRIVRQIIATVLRILVGWIVLMLLVHGVRLIITMIKFLTKSLKRERPPSSEPTN